MLTTMSWPRKCSQCLCLLTVLYQVSYAWVIPHIETFSDAGLSLTPFELNDFLEGKYLAKNWNGTWVSDVAFIYKNNEGDVMKFNMETKTAEVFLSAEILNKYPRSIIKVSEDEAFVLIKYNESAVFRHSVTALYTVYDIFNGKYYDIANLQPLQYVTFAPSGHGLVYILDNNIYYLEDFAVDVTNPVKVTTGGTKGVVYCGVADWVYEEEVLASESALWFSPNATNLAYVTFYDENVTDYSYFIYGDGTLYPKEAKIKYPKVGTINPTAVVYVYDITRGTTIEFQLPQEIISNKEPNDYIIYDLTWVTNDEVAMISTNRVQNESVLVRCRMDGYCWKEDARSESRGWIKPEIPHYSKNGKTRLEILPQPVNDDSFDHLVLTDISTGNKNRLTYGPLTVTLILGWDQERGLVYYRATVEDTPAEQQVYVVNLLGEVKCLSCDLIVDGSRCEAGAADFSKGFSYYVEVCSAPNPNFIVLASTKNDSDFLVWEDNLELRQRLLLKLQPIVTDLKVPLSSGFTARVRLFLPPSFDSSGLTKYPAIVNVYAGPNSNQISNGFSVRLQTYLCTKRQYIYILIDGRGSGKDGWNKTFQLYRRFGTVEIEDQIEVTRHLQEILPYIDATRTGIWGWSYGGFAASWALVKDTQHVFNFALAVAPVTSFIYYDSIYTERYMGLPTPEDNELGYNNTDLSRVVEAFRGRKYFIIHGNADDNVHYQNSMVLVKALEAADIDFRQQSYPDENHSLGHVSRHLYHLIDKYFARCFNVEGQPITSFNNNFLEEKYAR